MTFRYIDKLAPGIRVMLVPNDNPYLLPLPDLGLDELGTDGIVPESSPPSSTVEPDEGILPSPEPTPTPTEFP